MIANTNLFYSRQTTPSSSIAEQFSAIAKILVIRFSNAACFTKRR